MHLKERTHNLKKSSGEYKRQWHEYLQLAVLTCNTTYQSSIGCEPTRLVHGRLPFKGLDHKLGLNFTSIGNSNHSKLRLFKYIDAVSIFMYLT